jgi:hypothetical protein
VHSPETSVLLLFQDTSLVGLASRVAHQGAPMHRTGTDTGAPSETCAGARTNNFLQVQKFVIAVMCIVCCLVWLVLFGESTLATLSQTN